MFILEKKYFILLIKRIGTGIINKKFLLAILLLGFLIRAMFFFQIEPWDKDVVSGRILINDSYEYNCLAIHLQNGNFNGNTLRTPGYPFFLAIIYWIFGFNPYIAIVIQIFLSLFNIILTYYIALKLFNIKSLALLSAFFMAIDPHQSLYCNYLVTETLFVLVFLTSIYFLICYLKNNKKAIILLLSALFLGLSVLIRPISKYYFLISIFIIFFYYFPILKSKIFVSTTIYLIVFFVTVLPWQLRNYVLFDRFALSTVSGRALLLDSVVSTAQNVTGKPADTLRNEFILQTYKFGYDTIDNPFIKNDIRMKVAISYIKQHKVAYIKRHIIGCINVFGGLASKDIYESLKLGTGNTMSTNMFSSDSVSKQIKQFLISKSKGELILSCSILAYLGVIYFSFILGAVTLLRKKKYFILIVLVLSIIYFSGLTGVIGLARYRVPIMPFIILGSSYGIMLIFQKNQFSNISEI